MRRFATPAKHPGAAPAYRSTEMHSLVKKKPTLSYSPCKFPLKSTNTHHTKIDFYPITTNGQIYINKGDHLYHANTNPLTWGTGHDTQISYVTCN